MTEKTLIQLNVGDEYYARCSCPHCGHVFNDDDEGDVVCEACKGKYHVTKEVVYAVRYEE